MAAQYLQLHPTASPDEVKAALVAWSTPGIVVGAHQASNRLLFTNFTAPVGSGASGAEQAAAQGSGGGLSHAEIAGIAIGAFAGERSGPAQGRNVFKQVA